MMALQQNPFGLQLFRLRVLLAHLDLMPSTGGDYALPLDKSLKDGLNGIRTRDYRALAGVLFFAFPLCNNFVLVMEVILHDNYNINIFFLYFTSLLSLLVSFMRPLKSTIANMSVIFCFIMLEFLLICAYLMHFIQVEKSFLWNEGGCRDVMSPHEKEREQEDAHPKTESHPTPSLHLCFSMCIILPE